MSSARKVLPLAQLCARQFSQTAIKRAANEVPSKQFHKLKETQKKFQVDNGVPIYIKGGFMDRLLFHGTCVTTAVGLVMSLQVFWQLIQRH